MNKAIAPLKTKTTVPNVQMNPIHALPRRCLKDGNGDVAAATEKMSALIRKDESLFRQLMWPLIDNACYDAIRAECRTQRRKIWETPRYTEDNILAVASTRLMDLILPGGLTLGQAHRNDLLSAAEFYDRQAENMAHKGRFLSAIAEKLNGRRVNRVLNEADLCELQDETK